MKWADLSIILLLALMLVQIANSFSFNSKTSLTLKANPIKKYSRNLLKMTENIEQKGTVTMYKKDSCPYCQKAKTLLQEKYNLKINFVDVEVNCPLINLENIT